MNPEVPPPADFLPPLTAAGVQSFGSLPADRPPRVLIQARYSSEEQRQTSTEDQITNCRRFLADNLPRDVEIDRLVIEVIREPEVSGELMSRPGINEIWSGIESKRWDLIIAEESSRL